VRFGPAARVGVDDDVGGREGLQHPVLGRHDDGVRLESEAGDLIGEAKPADASVIPAPPLANCACNECPFMRLNTLEKVYLALRDLAPRIEMDASLRERARVPIDRMLALS